MMNRITNLCTYFRGRLDIPSAMQMTLTDLQALTYIMFNETQDEKNKGKKEGEILEDALVHGEV